uniref:Uncharacterized protein n=1 Tax=Aegilops tauschii subsp. strangulata TaxID=200361 RepID=A0A453GGA9_AEGTS
MAQLVMRYVNFCIYMPACLFRMHFDPQIVDLEQKFRKSRSTASLRTGNPQTRLV